MRISDWSSDVCSSDLMSAWFILSALGFYPVDPVSGVYVFGSPLFDVAEVRVGAGRMLTVRAENNAPDRPYVQSVRWNGKPWSRNWNAHADLIDGGELGFEMGAKPSDFGPAKRDRPPPFGATPKNGSASRWERECP